MVLSPWPIAVRRSVASTSLTRAGTSGRLSRSVRRKTTPCSGSPGRQETRVLAPVWRPTAESSAVPAMVRLGILAAPRAPQRLQIVGDLRQPVERRLRLEKLPVRPGRKTGEVGSVGHRRDDAGLGTAPG